MFSVPSSLALALRPLLLACLLPLALLPARASDDPVQPATALIGTWVHEKNVGIAKVTIHTTYRDDGTAVELVRVKPIFGHPSHVWTEYRWSLADRELRLTPLRSKADSPDEPTLKEDVVRQLVSIDAREMRLRRKDRERTDTRADLPSEVQKKIDELSRP